MESSMSETTGQKRTDRIKLESICNDEESVGFYASFEDGISIQYEPAGRLDPTKRTLWINADPDEVCIAFFDDKFGQGFNTENETGVWLSYESSKLQYHKEVVDTVDVLETVYRPADYEVDEMFDAYDYGPQSWRIQDGIRWVYLHENMWVSELGDYEHDD